MLIETQTDFKKLLKTLKRVKILAIDCEFIRTRTFFAKPSLLQIGWFDGFLAKIFNKPKAVAIDLTKVDIKDFASIWQDKNVVKLLHSGEQDIELLFQLTRKMPHNIFDSQTALQLLRFDGGSSYQALVEYLFGIRLDKSLQNSDWLKRPLSQKALEYAKADVYWLIQAYSQLVKKMKRKKCFHWFNQEVNANLQRLTKRLDPNTYHQTVYLTSKPHPLRLGFLKQLCILREGVAKSLDLPRSWVAHDSTLVKIVQQCPQNDEELRLFITELRQTRTKAKKPRQCHGLFLKKVAHLVNNHNMQALADIQRNRKKTPHRLKFKVELIRDTMLAQAKKDNIDPSLVYSFRELEALARGHPNQYQNTWRKEWVEQFAPEIVATNTAKN